jgi:hypothetical protein
LPFPTYDERIRDLCAKAVAADDTNFQPVMSELRAELRKHVQKIRRMAAQQIGEEQEGRVK